MRVVQYGALELDRAAAAEPPAALPSLVEGIADGVAVFDADLRLTACNARFLELLEYPAGFGEPGTAFADLVRLGASRGEYGPGDPDEIIERRLALARTDRAGRHEHVRPDGRVVETHHRPLPGGGFVRTCIDVTEQRRTEAELRQVRAEVATGHAELLEAFDSMADGLAIFDAEDRLVLWNRRYSEFHARIAPRLIPGLPFRELLRMKVEAGQYAGTAGSIDEYIRWRLANHREPNGSHEIQLSDGRWLRVSERRSARGSIVGISSEITELKEREAALTAATHSLRVQNVRFDTALNNMIQGLCMFDADQRLIVCNSRYLEIYGFSPDVVKPGIRLTDIMAYSVSLGNYTAEEGQRAIAERPTHAAMRLEAVLDQRLKDGRVIAVLHRPMPGGGSVATYQDVTELRRHEESLRDYATKLEQSNRELQHFASVASHDLQEPLRKIEAFGDRLVARCSGSLDADGRLYLDRMQNAASRMRELINDLLAYSRVSTKAQPFAEIDLAKIAAEVVEDLQVALEECGGRVDVEPLPTIDADSTQMRLLLQNLISNALKFRRKDAAPHVRISARLLGEAGAVGQEEAPVYELAVADNGIGFDEKYLDRIFTMFQRLHGRNEYAGTGIGLATCRKIVERHGGTITARSRPGEGSVFLVTLPSKQPDAE